MRSAATRRPGDLAFGNEFHIENVIKLSTMANETFRDVSLVYRTALKWLPT